jgi:hypothetical protein
MVKVLTNRMLKRNSINSTQKEVLKLVHTFCCIVYHRFIERVFLYRLVHSGHQTTSAAGADVLSFGTRSGTRNGVEMHIFRVETQRDLAHWSRALVQGSHGAAALVKEVTCRKYNLWSSHYYG